MLARLLLLFVAVPLVELTILLQLAERVSWQVTLGIVIVTGVVGSSLARYQGIATYRRIQQQLSQGRLPAESLFDGFLIFVAGVLLITPGILTDLLGLSLLIPLCRRFYRARLTRWFQSKFHIQTFRQDGGAEPRRQSKIIDSYVVDSRQDREKDRQKPDAS